MKLRVKETCIEVVADTPQDEVYLEHVLGLRDKEDEARATLESWGDHEKELPVIRIRRK